MLVLVGAALTATSCDDESDPVPTTTVTLPAEVTTTMTTPAGPPTSTDGDKPEDERPPRPDEPTVPAETPPGDPRQTALERTAERTVVRFVAALDARDGEAACALLAEGTIEQVELPEPSADCAAALGASIGYRDPRGLPVWESAEVATIVSVKLNGRQATVIATVITRFADRDEVSIEDDVVYLVREGNSWAIAKPSSTLYRAVGIADVPPSVLTPPR